MGLAASNLGAANSELWGANGENWTPDSRLPDFSRAGYHRGESKLPVVPHGVSVKDFGAVGDGKTDATDAFTKVLAATNKGVIEIPAGRFLITRPLEIRKSGVVLHGAGPDKSILFFPKPLNDVVPVWSATTSGQRTSGYSWSGGYVSIKGSLGSAKITDITAPAERGGKILTVASVDKLRVGQEIEVYQSDLPDNSLAIHLYSGDPGSIGKILGKASTSLISRITGIMGDRVALDRPLRCDLKLMWKPQLRIFQPSVTESGVENLGFEFPNKRYKGHFTELGFNPIALNGVTDCWMRNIRIKNADSGPFINGSFNTADGIVLESERGVDNQKCAGHHGISLGGTDNLLVNFEIRTRFIHDLTVDACCSGNVISRGKAVDLSLDHHKRSPYENLFTDLDAGAGTRLWKCGGGEDLGKNCGARGTFWNIRSANPLNYPPAAFGPPSMNLVALESKQAAETRADGKWFEPIPPSSIQPQNLHEAQRQRALATRPKLPGH